MGTFLQYFGAGGGDESIYIWTNKFNCPVWMFVLRKIHPNLNEYHTICCGESKIMDRWESVDGTYIPKELRRS